MHVSAQARLLDYTVRPLYPKSKNRSEDDETAPKRGGDEREDKDSRDPGARNDPEAAFEDADETLEYARAVPSQVTAWRDMVAETARPAPPIAATALWSLPSTVKSAAPAGGPAKPVVSPMVSPMVSKTPSAAKDALFALLDQVIAQA